MENYKQNTSIILNQLKISVKHKTFQIVSTILLY